MKLKIIDIDGQEIEFDDIQELGFVFEGGRFEKTMDFQEICEQVFHGILIRRPEMVVIILSYEPGLKHVESLREEINKGLAEIQINGKTGFEWFIVGSLSEFLVDYAPNKKFRDFYRKRLLINQ